MLLELEGDGVCLVGDCWPDEGDVCWAEDCWPDDGDVGLVEGC